MMRERTTGREGVAALEFGLILPLLMVILMGIIDYGYVYFVDLAMTNAAREGARVGVTRDTPDEAEDAAFAAATAYLDSAGIDTAVVTVTPPSDGDPAVKVEIALTVEPLVGLVPIPDQLQVSSTMRWELASP